MAKTIELAVARDFRLPGAPVGYIVIQTDAYYAWWQIHDPDAITIHDPAGQQLEWLTLRVGGSVEFADAGAPAPAPRYTLANLDSLGKQCEGGREWAGGKQESRTVEMIFRTESGGQEIRLTFHGDRIEYVHTAALAGPRRVRRCTFGISADGRRTSFQAGKLFNAGPTTPGIYHYPLHKPQYIRPDWFTPPPYFYAFQVGDGSWVGAGLEASVGQMPFTRYLTAPDPAGHLAFVVEYDSEPRFETAFTSPALTLRFGAADEYQALRQHAEGQVASGRLTPVVRKPAAWWQGVMVCGWHWQVTEAARYKTDASGAARQDLYEDMVRTFDRHGVAFDMMTIDAFWGKPDGIWRADPERWPDLRGFIDREHAKGRRVILWICTNVHGLPDDELYIVGDRRLLDPLNPKWKQRVADCCRYMFGDGPGCLNADGLKFDFTEMVPFKGIPSRCTRELHGLDYLHALFTTVYEAAKAVRADALMDFQVAHPAFAGVYDMSRLNDFFLPERQDLRVMQGRARIAEAVGFGALVDTDGPASEKYLRESHAFGNPSFYLAPSHFQDAALVAAMKAGVAGARNNSHFDFPPSRGAERLPVPGENQGAIQAPGAGSGSAPMP